MKYRFTVIPPPKEHPNKVLAFAPEVTSSGEDVVYDFMMDSEIDRLRAENAHLRQVNMNHVSRELYEAHVAELKAEVERLRKLPADISKVVGCEPTWEGATRAIASLVRENERLRELLDLDTRYDCDHD